MFGWFKRQSESSKQPVEAIACQPPGEVFPWPQGTVLTALDEVIIELPQAAFGNAEAIGSVVLGPSDMEINIPLQGESFYIRLKPGMSVSLSKSCQGRVVAEDKRPRRFRLSGAHVSDRPVP